MVVVERTTDATAPAAVGWSRHWVQVADSWAWPAARRERHMERSGASKGMQPAEMTEKVAGCPSFASAHQAEGIPCVREETDDMHEENWDLARDIR